MKILRFMLVLLIICSLCVVACGGNKKKPSTPAGPAQVWQPTWYNTQSSSEYVYSYGMSTNQSERGAVSSATAQARAEAGFYIETNVQAMVKDYFQEAGFGENAEITALVENVSKSTAKTSISGGLVTNQYVTQQNDGSYKVWIQYGFPRDQVNRSMLDAIKQETGAYNRLKASKSFAELEREMDKL
jgi:hypothetical protein